MLLVAAAVALAGCGSGGSGPRPVTIVLDFTPNAAHAGIYSAVAAGRDRAHGVRLVIRQPTATSDSLKLLGAGRADIAVADIHDLAIAREQGDEVVGVGALVQRPLAAVIAAPSVARPRALEGMRVGVTGVPSDNAVLDSTVSGDGGDPRRVRTITIGFDAVQSLLAHHVAAATAFWDVEGVTLRRRGFRPQEFRVDSYGAPAYPELVLVVRRDELTRERAALRNTLAALADGTRIALAHPTAAVREVAAASQADPGLVAEELAELRPALTPPIRLDRAKLVAWAAFDARFGIVHRRPDVDSTFAFGLAP
jgi:putative hydroxymethylpyrimidine transport system substrate-binding protein